MLRTGRTMSNGIMVAGRMVPCMELVTRSKRPGMECSIDVFYEECAGFSEHLDDKTTYKVVLVDRGSFVAEEDGKYRLITSPAAIAINEKAELKVISERGVKSRTLFFKPTILRDEFTIENLNSGKYDRFFSALPEEKELTAQEKMNLLIDGDVKFDECFSKEMIYQDALLLSGFCRRGRNISFYTLSNEANDTLRRFLCSIRYEVKEQPDNFWILRIRHFIEEILFFEVADFYRDYRQDEIYSDPLVVKVIQYFWSNMGEEITLATLLKVFSVNKNILNDAFNKEVGMPCMSYLENLRMAHARTELQYSDRTISEISLRCGYSDTNYFSKVFKKHMGLSPKEFRKNMNNLC